MTAPIVGTINGCDAACGLVPLYDGPTEQRQLHAHSWAHDRLNKVLCAICSGDGIKVL
jgi:hypothetical protein